MSLFFFHQHSSYQFLIFAQQTPDENSSAFKSRQLEERIHALESLLYDKDDIIYDLQHKLDSTKRVKFLFSLVSTVLERFFSRFQ